MAAHTECAPPWFCMAMWVACTMLAAVCHLQSHSDEASIVTSNRSHATNTLVKGPHTRDAHGCMVKLERCSRSCLTTTPSVAGSDAFDQRPPFSILPPVHRFRNKMKTLPPAQRAAGSDAADERPHIFAVSKKSNPSQPLPWRVPMALEERGSASGRFACT